MPILIDKPIVKPATPEITFDTLYAVNINISAIRDATGRIIDGKANIQLNPYDSVTKIDAQKLTKNMVVPSITARISADPTGILAQAYGLLVAAIDEEFKKQLAEKKAIEDAAANEGAVI